MSRRHGWALTALVAVLAAWRGEEAARVVYREAEERSEREYLQPSLMAWAAASVGEMDRAVSLAEQALERDPLFVLMARTWPTYDRLRADPRFLEIVRRLDLPAWTA
jgi:hypothetical protein